MNAGRARISVLFILIPLLILSCSQGQPSAPKVVQIQSETDLPTLTFHGAYPNPFKTKTYFAYDISIASADKIELLIFNSSGERVKTYSAPSNLASDTSSFLSRSYPFTIGYSECIWDGMTDAGDAPNGVYYVEARMTKGEQTVTQIITCMRVR